MGSRSCILRDLPVLQQHFQGLQMVFPFRLSQKARSNPHLCALSGLAMLLIAAVSKAPAQSGYTVIPVTNGGTIAGTVKWSGPEPKGFDVPVNKDPEICDPESH